MFKKVMLVAVVIAVLMGIGGTAVFADDGASCPATYSEDTGTYVQGFCDGRVNAFDMTASAVVYYDYKTVATVNTVTDADGTITGYVDSTADVVSAVEIWVIDGDGVGQPALTVPVETINAAIARGADAQIAAGNGVSLNYSAWGALWISAPGGYTFAWEPAW
jgi:hypothetical protein